MTLIEEIENKALTLTEQDRGHLIHDLIQSLDEGKSQSDDFEAEIQRRIEKIKSGKAFGVSAEDVFSRIEGKYK